MDSFEARLKFIQVLKTLPKTINTIITYTPSINNDTSKNIDPIQFYLSCCDSHYEDFQQCFFDTMNKMDPLDRLNVLIYYCKLIETLKYHVDVADDQNKKHIVYDVLLTSMAKIYLMTLPDDLKSLTNLGECVYRFRSMNELFGYELESKQNLDELVHKYESNCAREDISSEWYLECESQRPKESFENITKLLQNRILKQSQFYNQFVKREYLTSQTDTSNSQTILHRMENDRERHKKLKEHSWVIQRETDNTNMMTRKEFEKLWNNTNDTLSKEDYNNMHELNEIAKQSYLTSI